MQGRLNRYSANRLVERYIGTAYPNVKAVAENLPEITSLNSSLPAVEAVHSSLGDITAVVDNIIDVVNVSDNMGIVTDVFTNLNNISAVQANEANINAVVAAAPQINVVAPLAADLNTVANNISDVVTVSGISTNVSTVASNVTDVNTVAANITDVSATGGNIADVITVAALSGDMTQIIGISTEIQTVATNASDIQDVADDIVEVKAVGTNITNINFVSNNLPAIQAAANIITLTNTQLDLELGPTESPGFVYENITDAVTYGITQLQRGGTIVLKVPAGSMTVTEPTEVLIDGYNLTIEYETPTTDYSAHELTILLNSGLNVFKVINGATLIMKGITVNVIESRPFIRANNSTVTMSSRINKSSLGIDLIIGENNSYINADGAYFWHDTQNAMIPIKLNSSRATISGTTFEPTAVSGPNENILVQASRMSTVVIESNGVNAFYDDSVAPAYIAKAEQGSRIFIPGEVGGEINGWSTPVTTAGFTNPYSPALNVEGNTSAIILR